MNKQEAKLLTLKLFGRYPSAPRDETTLLAWTEELTRRYSTESSSDVERAAIGCCRAKAGTFIPSLDEVCSYVTGQLTREQRQALPEPELTKDEAKSIVAFWMGEAERVIGKAGQGNKLPAAFGPLDTMRLYHARKGAGIPGGRTRWGLELTNEQIEQDRELIRRVDERRRA